MPAAIPGRIATQIRVNENVYEKVKAIAKKENRNTNSQIEYFLKIGVAEYERNNGIIQIQSKV